jgi:hypothetical protein
MKKALCLLLSAAFSFTCLRGFSQCTVSNIVVQNATVLGSLSPGTCTVKFDVAFTIENNNGNKYIFIHAWLKNDYPDYFQCVDGQSTLPGAPKAPEASDLGDEFITIGINNDINPPQLLTSYTPDTAVPITPVNSIQRTLLPDGSAIFILKGVTATAPVSCGTPVVIVADLWSSQSAMAQRAHCVNCGIMYSAGFFNAAGSVNCSTLTFGAMLTNFTTDPVTGYYRVFADINGDNYFTEAVDTMIIGATNFSIAAGVGMQTPITGAVPPLNVNQNLFLVLTQTSGSASGASFVVFLPTSFCGTLPVTLTSFTAVRNNSSQVALRWETMTETNNRGFSLMRNRGNNNWEVLAFIPSQMSDGNSSLPLSYSYLDMNNTNKGITQYRIRQVDIDGRSTFSPIRAVRGLGQRSAIIIYPNPTVDGSVTIVFEDKDAKRDMILSDLSGRVLKQWKTITGNTIQLDQLRKGMYLLRVTDVETGLQSVEKIVVSNEAP